jgi:hypothetical protein
LNNILIIILAKKIDAKVKPNHTIQNKYFGAMSWLGGPLLE